MEPIITIAAAVLSGLTTSGAKALSSTLGARFLHRNKVQEKLTTYLQHLTNKTAYFVTYRISRQHIDDAYIEPRIIDAAVSRLHLPPDEYKLAMQQLKARFDNIHNDHTGHSMNERLNAAKRFDVELSFITAKELASTKDDCVVLADAGDGKSSLLAYLCWARLNASDPKIPIFLDSRNLGTASLTDRLREGLTKIGLTEFAEQIPILGEALTVYVDGLDELSNEKYTTVCREINELNSESPEIQFTIACRSGAYRGDFAQMLEVSIAPFDQDQSEQFVRSWFGATTDGRNADELIGQLRAGDRLSELATKPLLLSLMCSAFRRYLNLSRRPTALFQQCIDSLLWEWDSQRVVKREGSFANLDIEKKSWLHSLLAKELHSYRLKYCDKNIPEKLLRDNLSKFGVTNENSAQVLAELVSHHSIFVKWTEETYGFGHLALQEFLTAQWYKNDRRWTEFLKPEILNDAWWEYVIAFCFASLDDATEAITRVFDDEKVSEIRRTQIAAHCLRYDPVVDDSIRDKVIRKILHWYHNGDAEQQDAALFMLVGIDDEWTAPTIRRSLAGTLTAEQLSRVISHRVKRRLT